MAKIYIEDYFVGNKLTTDYFLEDPASSTPSNLTVTESFTYNPQFDYNQAQDSGNYEVSNNYTTSHSNNYNSNDDEDIFFLETSDSNITDNTSITLDRQSFTQLSTPFAVGTNNFQSGSSSSLPILTTTSPHKSTTSPNSNSNKNVSSSITWHPNDVFNAAQNNYRNWLNSV
ncbi:hypothetical protein TBLA_0G01780 [Henningerozyma blattae CBS 6284]|uniref:Uncharacterized protein n=1 Tax=Henningerozyma blattae (strain ATCC 34711 / CBS 6284 / DSM 70876 / NBRC 10599 / NRRL Y-10934 / UCD 77-7) TaxID=1071380 RepID=I2H6W9_HENB6|nr:hypothetical protein TBLA_0G01780 [Tetrapisispora blattae CBS 6284]CCH62121.1 hypothetical protein TBLA_0G01780 [Tetrapisispora blattae CBS 6284]